MAAKSSRARAYKIRPTSRRLSVVALQQPAQPLAAVDNAFSRRRGLGFHDPAAERLVRPLQVVMLHELVDDVANVPLPEQDHLVQALALDGADERLGVGVQV